VGCEDWLGRWASGGGASPRLWTDAYLAAFASSGGYRLVSFDRDFAQFEGLNVRLLAIDEHET